MENNLPFQFPTRQPFFRDRRVLPILGIGIFVISIALVVFVINRQTTTRSQAAAVNHETEEGVLEGPATIQSAGDASGEQYVQFGQ